jgi:hypothetical protein
MLLSDRVLLLPVLFLLLLLRLLLDLFYLWARQKFFDLKPALLFYISIKRLELAKKLYMNAIQGDIYFGSYSDAMYIKKSLTILGMIVGVAATTGLVTALSMSETALAVGGGGGCGTGGGSDGCTGTGFIGGHGAGGGVGVSGGGGGSGTGYGDTDILTFNHCGVGTGGGGGVGGHGSNSHSSCFD